MIGLALVNECISHGIHVIALIRSNSAKKPLLPESDLVTVIEKDLHELSALDTSGLEAETFYHFAWDCTDGKNRNNVEAQNANIGYTLDAVQLAKKMRCKTFIGSGSQAEYGRVEGTISSDMRVAPESAYGVAKYAAGKLSSLRCEQLGISHIWTRIFSVYGINDMPSTMIMYCVNMLLSGKKPLLTKCEQKWDYLNCRDAARAFYLIGTKGKSRSVYNIGSGAARPLREFVTQIRDIVAPNLPIGIGEREYAEKQVMHLCADISDLTRDTGFKPSISFEDGVKEIIEWCGDRDKKDDYRKNGSSNS